MGLKTIEFAEILRENGDNKYVAVPDNLYRLANIALDNLSYLALGFCNGIIAFREIIISDFQYSERV